MNRTQEQITEKTDNPLDREFIRILTDFGFKRVFGSRSRSHLLRRFLNALFEGEFEVESVEFRDKELIPIHEEGKKILYDIYCRTDTGHNFILEMQQEESEYFPDRIIFYLSRAMVDQGHKGGSYELDPVYCVVLTNFNISYLSKKLVHDIALLDRQTHELYSDKVRLMFISLRETPEVWEECDTELKRLLYLIKNMENMTKKSKPYVNGEYDEFFTASSVGRLTNEEAIAYSNSYYRELDHQSAVRLASRRAWNDGVERGVAQTQREIVGRMHRNGMSVMQIAAILNYPESTIRDWLS